MRPGERLPVDGVVLDGFPRTPVQVECLKLLVDRIRELYDEFSQTPLAIHFRRPTIHVMVLFVGEGTSVARQLGRGREIAALLTSNKRKEALTDLVTRVDDQIADGASFAEVVGVAKLPVPAKQPLLARFMKGAWPGRAQAVAG